MNRGDHGRRRLTVIRMLGEYPAQADTRTFGERSAANAMGAAGCVHAGLDPDVRELPKTAANRVPARRVDNARVVQGGPAATSTAFLTRSSVFSKRELAWVFVPDGRQRGFVPGHARRRMWRDDAYPSGRVAAGQPLAGTRTAADTSVAPWAGRSARLPAPGRPLRTVLFGGVGEQ